MLQAISYITLVSSSTAQLIQDASCISLLISSQSFLSSSFQIGFQSIFFQSSLSSSSCSCLVQRLTYNQTRRQSNNNLRSSSTLYLIILSLIVLEVKQRLIILKLFLATYIIRPLGVASSMFLVSIISSSLPTRKQYARAKSNPYLGQQRLKSLSTI